MTTTTRAMAVASDRESEAGPSDGHQSAAASIAHRDCDDDDDSDNDNGPKQLQQTDADLVDDELARCTSQTPLLVDGTANRSLKGTVDRRVLVDDELARYTSETPLVIDDATNRRLKRAVDRRVLVVMVVTYFLQSVDKSALSFASIMGIRRDAHLSDSQYSWLTTIIYLVVLVVEYPENCVIQRVRIAKWLGANVMLWGAVVALTAACRGFRTLMAARALLGVFECVCQPAFTLLSAMWYRREEQAATVVLWYMMNGLQQIVGGFVAFLFTRAVAADAPLAPWQALFVTHGGVAFLWGIFIVCWLPDSPMRARCFSETDKRLLVERVRENRTGLQNKTFRPEQVKEALLDPQVHAFILVQFFATLPSGGLGAYAAIILESFGFDVWVVQLLQMVTGLVQMAAMVSGVWVERRYGQTILPSVASVVPTVAGAAVLTAVPATPATRVGLLVAWYAMYSFWCAVGLTLSLVTRNVAGQTKKSVVISLNFIAWAAGNAVGPQIFRQQDAPRYFLAFSVILTCFVSLIVTLFLLRTWYIWQNSLKQAKIDNAEAVEDSSGVHAFEDITDMENVNFRYDF